MFFNVIQNKRHLYYIYFSNILDKIRQKLLGVRLPLRQIIWFFTGFYADLYLGFSVYVSNTTDILHGTLCFKDNIYTKSTLPSVFTTDCFVHGQYIIYYNERIQGVVYPDDYLSVVRTALCEVEVYGEWLRHELFNNY